MFYCAILFSAVIFASSSRLDLWRVDRCAFARPMAPSLNDFEDEDDVPPSQPRGEEHQAKLASAKLGASVASSAQPSSSSGAAASTSGPNVPPRRPLSIPAGYICARRPNPSPMLLGPLPSLVVPLGCRVPRKVSVGVQTDALAAPQAACAAIQGTHWNWQGRGFDRRNQFLLERQMQCDQFRERVTLVAEQMRAIRDLNVRACSNHQTLKEAIAECRDHGFLQPGEVASLSQLNARANVAKHVGLGHPALGSS